MGDVLAVPRVRPARLGRFHALHSVPPQTRPRPLLPPRRLDPRRPHRERAGRPAVASRRLPRPAAGPAPLRLRTRRPLRRGGRRIMTHPDPACSAGTHGDTWWYYTRYGCRCPTAVNAAKTLWREASAARHRRAADGAPCPEAMSKRRLPDVDPVSVERACAGQPHLLTVAERAQAVALLTRLGLSARQIAARLGVSERTVVRHRKATTP